jgi:transcriptional regulator with XRE-family HTH domain
MKDKKPSIMRDLRKSQNPPLTLKELARRAGVSYTTVWNLENGLEEKVHFEIKDKVAQILKVKTAKLFPREAARVKSLLTWIGRAIEITNDQVQETLYTKDAQRFFKQNIAPIGRYHRLKTLMDFCPSLEFKYEIDVENILRKMTPDELGSLYHSGLMPGEAVRQLNRTARRLGLKAVELRKK